MITEFHFIRPLWLIALLPFIVIVLGLFKYTPYSHAWHTVCDSHLLTRLLQGQKKSKHWRPLVLLLCSALLMIMSLAGPTWSRFPVPTYQQIQPRVIVMDLSQNMLAHDLSPDRLSRAKFKIHDLLQHQNAGQFALVVYTGEPFVVSPLTDDGQTIDALISSLSPDIMPVTGNDINKALQEAGSLINDAGFQTGQILLLPSQAPSNTAINTAKRLAKQGINTSVIPIIPEQENTHLFEELARAGKGQSIVLTDTNLDINQWLKIPFMDQHYTLNNQQDIPIWRDQGRWFLIPALIFMLPMFRRGWLQGINR